MLQSLLKGTGLTLQQLQYAVHPGGPKILDVLADALGVKHEQLKVSWEVLNQVRLAAPLFHFMIDVKFVPCMALPPRQPH